MCKTCLKSTNGRTSAQIRIYVVDWGASVHGKKNALTQSHAKTFGTPALVYSVPGSTFRTQTERERTFPMNVRDEVARKNRRQK